MHITFLHRLYVRLWLAVVLAVLVLSMLVGWLLRLQAERIRAERLAEVPAREVLMRNTAGEIVGKTTVQPVRVPGRGVEFHIRLPAGVQGGEQLAISLPPRPRPEIEAASTGRTRAWSFGSLGERGAGPTIGFLALLTAFAFAVALGSYPVVRRLMKRLEGLRRGVERLGAGDLRARVDESGQDEVAFLAQRFNRAADQIETLMQSQKSLLANASHELRSPLARIRMGVELMAPSANASLKTELLRNVDELDMLIDEILLASRLEAAASGEMKVTREQVDMLALAAEEGARLSVELTWQGEAEQAILLGDARLLRRMIRNLLENAQRHGGQGVSLSVSAEHSQVLIEVADTGPGVPVSERERIFEPFYRTSVASESHGGVGLGLSLVRAIARQHGGDVQCLAHSRTDLNLGGGVGVSADHGATVHQGAKFLVRLPK
jgi:two-component system, OmpR family, sensor kinase